MAEVAGDISHKLDIIKDTLAFLKVPLGGFQRLQRLCGLGSPILHCERLWLPYIFIFDMVTKGSLGSCLLWLRCHSGWMVWLPQRAAKMPDSHTYWDRNPDQFYVPGTLCQGLLLSWKSWAGILGDNFDPQTRDFTSTGSYCKTWKMGNLWEWKALWLGWSGLIRLAAAYC